MLHQQNLMLFCLHLKTGRILVPTGQTPDTFTHPSKPITPERDYVSHQVIIWWRCRESNPGPKCLFRINQHLRQYL